MTNEPARERDIVELAEHWEGQCNRYVNGQCSTLRCLVRGGYKINSGPCDNSIATCEEHETATRLRELLSIEQDDVANGSISGVLMSDVREARKLLATQPKQPTEGGRRIMDEGASGDELKALAERIEAAAGPDRELDFAIWRGLGNGTCWPVCVPRYTASLDAAMTLVPEGYLAATVNWSRIGSGVAEVYLGNPEPMFGSEAATPALALTAAALRAIPDHSASIPSEGGAL